jgi:hypothetical protein
MHLSICCVDFNQYAAGGAPKGGAAGLQPPPPETPQNRNFKNIDFVDIMIAKVLRDLLFS